MTRFYTAMFIFDGCSPHYNDLFIKKAIEMSNIWILFAYNVTHIFHPLEISVFNTFKENTE